MGLAAAPSFEKMLTRFFRPKVNGRILFEKLANRSIDRETFKEKKQAYDSEIEALGFLINAWIAMLCSNPCTIQRTFAAPHEC